MSPEILLVRHGEGYRILHGHLRLSSVLSGLTERSEATVEASGEGKVKLVKTPHGVHVVNASRRLPLLANA